MSGVWIGECHLRAETDRRRIRAAALCQGPGSWTARVRPALEAAGWHLELVVEVLQHETWRQAYPGDAEALALADRVAEGHPVAFGSLLDFGAGRGAAEVPLIGIEELPPVTPLGPQIGRWPKACAPEALRGPLFGGADADGGAAPATYAVIDAARVPLVSGMLAGSGLAWRCLFTGEAEETLGRAAPYLVALDPESEITRALMTTAAAPGGLWQRQPGMFLRADGGFDALWHHLHQFVRVRGDDGGRMFLRFWEGATFVDYWSHFAASRRRVGAFFHTADGLPLTLFLRAGERVFRLAPTTAALGHEGAYTLDAEDREVLRRPGEQAFRAAVCAALEQRLDHAPPDARARIPATVDGAFAYIARRSGGRGVGFDDCVTLSLLVLLWADAAPAILDGPLMNEGLLPIGQRIRLSQGSYQEALDGLARRAG